MRKNRPAFYIGEETLGKIRGHDIELYLDVEKPYPPILRRPPHPEIMETWKEIEKHVKELLDMNVIRNIGHNEIVEVTTPVLITCPDGESRLCGDFGALKNYTKADRNPIPRITHALDKLEKGKQITKIYWMKGFHQNGLKPKYMKLPESYSTWVPISTPGSNLAQKMNHPTSKRCWTQYFKKRYWKSEW
ncbi:hypothetical protein O181_097645 [Austropuccinia psidii MF-1]|uniref:Uncharacterized protein n=1 Tax=Austropuccinia psidii MF-1 TaxID=1389203 RepID=A0A9Q3PE57_9BASI|nr:hypothetical protein [Austropuccinia psidii MF-1]